MACQFVYDAARGMRLELLARSSHADLAGAVRKVMREEKYHRMHTESWIGKLAQGSAESRERLLAALAALWPDMRGFFEPAAAEAELVSSGVLASGFGSLETSWREAVGPVLRRH